MKNVTLEEKTADISADLSVESLALNAIDVFKNAQCKKAPFKHWLFSNVLPAAICNEIIALPIAPVPVIDTYGKRDSHNEIRKFFSPEMQEQYPVMRVVAETFQRPEVARAIEEMCGVELEGSYLRIEYCQDRNGFWLEPHMDIPEKFITMQVYLNTGLMAETLGTDLYDSEKQHVGSAPSQLGEAMLFVPKEPESWHGFEGRAIPDVRRSLIINYVTDDWRSRHELSFPDKRVS